MLQNFRKCNKHNTKGFYQFLEQFGIDVDNPVDLAFSEKIYEAVYAFHGTCDSKLGYEIDFIYINIAVFDGEIEDAGRKPIMNKPYVIFNVFNLWDSQEFDD